MKRREIIILLVSSVVVVLFWIIFNVYHNAVTSTIPETISVQISTISPNFDTKTIDMLKKRQQITPVFEFKKGLSENSSATNSSAIITLTPTPSVSIQLESQVTQSTQGASVSP
ncbi:MAG: hypothetical protein M1524_03600 [Patescibacteria group bacterium]|nr:hypothetical protein [Patescibacteria group bacterium]